MNFLSLVQNRPPDVPVYTRGILLPQVDFLLTERWQMTAVPKQQLLVSSFFFFFFLPHFLTNPFISTQEWKIKQPVTCCNYGSIFGKIRRYVLEKFEIILEISGAYLRRNMDNVLDGFEESG